MKRLLRSRYFAGAATVAIGTAIGQVVVLLASPLLTRLYEPNELGDLAVFAAILSTLVVIGSLRYQLAIPLPENEDTAWSVLIVSLVTALSFAAVVGAVVYLLREPMARWTNAEIFSSYWWVLPISLLAASTYQALSMWAIRLESYGLLARTRVTQSVGMVGVQTGLGFTGLGSLGLLIGDAVGRAAGSGSLLATAVSRADRRMVGRSDLWAAAMRYRRFPLISTWSGLLNAVGIFSPPIMVAGLYGSRVAGFFALAQRVIAAPVTLVSFSVSQVFLGRAAHLARGASGSLHQLVRSTGRRLLLVGLVPGAVLLIAAPGLFAFVFGENWRTAGTLAQLLVPSFLLQFAVVPISQTLNVLEKQDLQLIWDALRLVAVVASLLVPALMNSSIRVAVGAYAGVSALAYSCLWYLAVRETNRGSR